nr:MAG TPA_asm: hypothetical protein [Caudoviricetes sp.]
MPISAVRRPSVVSGSCITFTSHIKLPTITTRIISRMRSIRQNVN